ncbi:ABC transporter substrate-binding protein [uncultured Methylobacterium sp.]|mgnify:CR=1 FL=1|jgi:iron complex transport system substrate-binding protein|uniref:heme/hemin ABC transporter substrate-binding protein n=1 Tax=uncultured Methylobacterium sp. TaxID=157278 RepID=UPI0026226AFB|nr:ABC transporter substrate-binding protein [uncultured Methylobacterium sp.]
MTRPASLAAPSRRAVLLGAGLLLARPARAQQPAARIASLGGAVTEILYALGAAPRIVAVDSTSLHPPEAMREKPVVGYLRALSAEGLLSTRPDLVIAAEGAGPPDVLTLVREAGVRVELVAEPPSAGGVRDKILAVGRLAGLEREAQGLAARVEAGFSALAASRARIAAPVRALVVLSLQNGRVMVGGRGSTADGMLALAGARNAAEGVEGFRPITDEALIAAAPEVVVMMRTGHGEATPEAVFAGPGLSRTPAAVRRALVTMDGLALLGFGPRTPEAAGELMRRFYPDLPRE